MKNRTENLCRRNLSFFLLTAGLLIMGTSLAPAQQVPTPRMIQDPALDNLEHDPGYVTSRSGRLGEVVQVGNGPQPMVLIAGAGFGPEVFQGFMQANTDSFTMYAVALPGFGGSPAPPMPPSGTSYGEQTWLTAARDAVADLIVEKQLQQPIIVGHWINATQVALGLAVERPELIRAAIIISGVPKSISSSGPQDPTPEMRALMIDMQMAPGWFKTVTRETWDDNNFMPRDYAIHPLRGLQLWKDAAVAPLPINIRYLCEYWAKDSTLDLDRLQVPVLVIKPRFDELYAQGPQQGGGYMEMFLHDSWDGVQERSDLITMEIIEDSRVFIMDDQPVKLNQTIHAYLDGPASRAPRVSHASAPVSSSPAPASSVPGFWQGEVQREGSRYLVGDSTVSLELPETWELEGIADEPPLVVRMKDDQEKAEITIQVHPTPGMSLDTITPMIEARLAGQADGFTTKINDKTQLDGQEAVHLEGTYEKDEKTGLIVLIITKLDDNFLMTVSFRASQADHDRLRPQFDSLAGSIDLRMDTYQR